MVNYQQGKIYLITAGKYRYIGSTTQKLLSTRLAEHKSHYRQWVAGKKGYCTSFALVKYSHVKIELIEDFPCRSKKQLRERENYWMERCRFRNLVNRYSPI